MPRDIPLTHPGVLLRQDFLDPAALTPAALARAIKTTRPRVNELCLGRRPITADMALRLGRFFGTSPQFWLNLQARYDLEGAREAIAGDLAAIEPQRQAA